ncbi:hypothetical protein [Sutcliffiella horikoshii]|uniref:hypothetical protein n=1 Tax=Sutcliffiella horikoshii TaxID=79883 RepID=UPI001F413560|nr:hypothetical protein [Sutcliffiella horikoshii]
MDYNDYHYKQPNHLNHGTSPGRHDWDNSEVTIGTWIVVLLLIAIPLINIIVLLVLAFGDHNVNLKNFAKASLILMVVGFMLALLVSGCSF